MVTGSDFTPAVSRETSCIFHAVRRRWLLAFDCVSATFRNPRAPICSVSLWRWRRRRRELPTRHRATSDPRCHRISVPGEPRPPPPSPVR